MSFVAQTNNTTPPEARPVRPRAGAGCFLLALGSVSFASGQDVSAYGWVKYLLHRHTQQCAQGKQ